ncbi:MAG: DUF4919 domain-containing protein [Taibaiella sp.]|nr:DUF4919 domain-containing protein [Taibaiella sp.]
MPQRLILIFIVVLLPHISMGQTSLLYTPPDYKAIESATNDKKKETYYPKLLKRYKANDTSLSKQEIALLYYGKFFQEGMSSFGKNLDLNDSVNAINKKETLTDDDNKRLLDLYLKQHDSSPFDLATLYRLSDVCGKLKDPRAAAYDYYLSMIMRTIVSTGDGKTKEAGFHIGSVSDEYSFLSLLGFKFGGSQSLIGSCDYLTVGENDYDIKGIYFNIEQILKEESKLFGLDDLSKNTIKKMKKADKKEKDKKAK